MVASAGGRLGELRQCAQCLNRLWRRGFRAGAAGAASCARRLVSKALTRGDRWVADALADFEVERMGVIGGEVTVSRALADMLEPGHH